MLRLKSRGVKSGVERPYLVENEAREDKFSREVWGWIDKDGIASG